MLECSTLEFLTYCGFFVGFCLGGVLTLVGIILFSWTTPSHTDQ
jgi:hypothetical protein